uniref:Uncharacterized protein LOC111114316 n=1 Tax=Crassostrea virginica TaxID=6565 RepID=A0A8B8BY47_CRAVI|nr:uncharacterized protein LOC111114316 [Crassostrea virginica]
MQPFLSVWVQFLLFHIVLTDTGSLLKHGYSRIIYGHRLDGKTISSFAPITFLDCVEECLVRNRCQSVSYFKGANYCEIKFKDKLTAESSYQEQAGWVYSEKGHWPPELAGPCSQSNCSLNEKCQLTRYSSNGDPFHCVVSDCGLPVINGINESYTKEGDAIGINRAMHVRCSEQHGQHGSGRLVCLSNGTWVYNIICKYLYIIFLSVI